MPTAVDSTLMRVFNTMDAGIGCLAGKRTSVPKTICTPLEWATSRAEAEKAQSAPDFQAWLTSLRPSPASHASLTPEEASRQNMLLSDIANIIKDAIETDLERVHVDNFSMEAEGFHPPIVITTFRWIAITLAQQSLLHSDFDRPIGQSEDFMRVYEAGHLPVGCKETAEGNTLLIW